MAHVAMQQLQQRAISRCGVQFVEDEASPYAQLEAIRPVRAGEQLYADYGPTYAYSAHRFARFSGAGPALIADPSRISVVRPTGGGIRAICTNSIYSEARAKFPRRNTNKKH